MIDREIRVLPERVINQIAAGEVVERPASVVKELVENSLDAGAGHITIDVEDGGKTLIRVIDDGAGMTRAEMHVALRRHATSKLRAVSDLFGLSTLGFRGEALPAVASVSRMLISSRRQDGSDLGAWQLGIEAGRVVSEREVGAPAGTRIEVRDLLYNLPARRKFIKADATEAAHISDCVSKLALANPDVHIRLRHGNRVALDAPRARSNRERATAILGDQLVAASERAGGVEARVFLSPPARAQKSARAIQLFVGRRAIRDRGLLHAVVAGYGDMLGSGRYPVAVVFVEVADDAVDINVHPQKVEVRFADPQSVYAVVKGTVERAVAAAGWRAAPMQERAAGARAAVCSTGGASSTPLAAERLASYAASRRLFPLVGTRAPRADAIARPGGYRSSRHRGAPRVGASPDLLPPGALGPPAGFFSRLRYLGQLDGTYLVCEGDGELVLIDQRLARVRVFSDELRRSHASRAGAPPPQQPLLFPESLEVSAAELACARRAGGTLRELGFDVEARDDAPPTIAVSAAPGNMSGADASGALLDVLRALAADSSAGDDHSILAVAHAALAHRLADRANESLEHSEAEALLCDLDAVEPCGHRQRDRPIVLRITIDELAQRFTG